MLPNNGSTAVSSLLDQWLTLELQSDSNKSINTHAQSVRDPYMNVTHTHRGRTAVRLPVLNTELCIHSFRDKGRGRSWWKRKKEAEENIREWRGRLKHTHIYTHTAQWVWADCRLTVMNVKPEKLVSETVKRRGCKGRSAERAHLESYSKSTIYFNSLTSSSVCVCEVLLFWHVCQYVRQACTRLHRQVAKTGSCAFMVKATGKEKMRGEEEQMSGSGVARGVTEGNGG